MNQHSNDSEVHSTRGSINLVNFNLPEPDIDGDEFEEGRDEFIERAPR